MSSENRKVYSYMIDRLAVQLQTHISTLDEIQKSLALYDALRSSRTRKDIIENTLQNLRELRQSMLESIEYLMNEARNASTEDLEDAEALLEYFLEAGYKYEHRVLEEVKKRIGHEEELRSLDQMKGLVEEALDKIRSYKRV